MHVIGRSNARNGDLATPTYLSNARVQACVHPTVFAKRLRTFFFSFLTGKGGAKGAFLSCFAVVKYF